LLGSVSQKCVTHARCPVVVVPAERGPIGGGESEASGGLAGPTGVSRIVVGVDGSDGSRAALRWGLQEAASRAAPLVAVMAWSYLEQHHARGEPSFTPDYHEGEAKAALDEVVHEVVQELVHAPDASSSVAGGVADVVVEARTLLDLPALALLKTVRADDLLVVGSRGRGGFVGMLLGSVSQHCVTHAPCAVAVVRPPRPEEPPVEPLG
jgi:nucleotide-binding universal stress UspA family protein